MLAAMTIPGLAIALFLLAAAEVLWRKLTGRRLLRRADGRTSVPVAAGGFELLDTVFTPGKHHEMEQRHTSLLRREDEANGEPPLIAVDLDASRVRINTAAR